MTRSRKPKTRLGCAGASSWASDVALLVEGCRIDVCLDRQEIPIKLVVAFPAQTLVELLRGVVVDRRLQGQAVSLGCFGELPGAFHQCTPHAQLARFRRDKQVVQNPLPR